MRLGRPDRFAALRTIGWAAGLGTIMLGIGSRLAMHAIALLNTGSGRFTFGGTLTVVVLGAASGVLAGTILLGIRILVRGRWTPSTTALFWLVLIAVTLRGLRPLDGQRLALFLPLIVMFGIVLQWITWPGRHPVPPDRRESLEVVSKPGLAW